MGRVVNAINEVCTSRSRPILYSLWLVHRITQTIWPPKYLGLNYLALSTQNLYSIQSVIFPEHEKRIFFIDFSPHLRFAIDGKPTCTLYGYMESLYAVASSHLFITIVADIYIIVLTAFGKKETHLFLTTEWRVVQSSWSILEQYMGRWPKAIIQGLLARFSGLFASLRSFVNHSTCSATEPLVK